jgi:hypothetical protein
MAISSKNLPRYAAPMSQIQALILSIAVEAVIAFALVRGLRWGRGLLAALAATLGTLFTHPVVWTIVPPLETPLGYATAVVLAETGVVLAESVAYRLIVPLAWPRALVASLIANGGSVAAGLVYYAIAR